MCFILAILFADTIFQKAVLEIESQHLNEKSVVKFFVYSLNVLSNQSEIKICFSFFIFHFIIFIYSHIRLITIWRRLDLEIAKISAWEIDRQKLHSFTQKTETNICLVVTRIVFIQPETEQGFLTNIFD
jgi:hypothetical protein